jgi:hypothetical protein
MAVIARNFKFMRLRWKFLLSSFTCHYQQLVFYNFIYMLLLVELVKPIKPSQFYVVSPKFEIAFVIIMSTTGGVLYR